MLGKIRDAPLASLLKKEPALGGRANLHPPCVLRIFGDDDQPAAREAGHHTAHRGRLDLLGGREFAERLRTSENEHGERGKTRRTFPGGDVLLAQPAQQVDRGGVQPVGNGPRSILIWMFDE